MKQFENDEIELKKIWLKDIFIIFIMNIFSNFLCIGILYAIQSTVIDSHLVLKLIFVLFIMPGLVSVSTLLLKFSFTFNFQNQRNIQDFEEEIEEEIEGENENVVVEEENEKIQSEKSGQNITNNQIEKTVTAYLKKMGRYGFSRSEESFISAILYQINYEYGKNITRDRLFDCLSNNSKYTYREGMYMNINEKEQDDRDWKHLHNDEPEKVGTSARPKMK